MHFRGQDRQFDLYLEQWNATLGPWVCVVDKAGNTRFYDFARIDERSPLFARRAVQFIEERGLLK